MRLDYPLKTDRLLLRPFRPDDLDDFHAYRSRPEFHRYLYDEAATREECVELLDKLAADDELTGEGQRLALAIHLPEAGRVIGGVVLKWRSEAHRQGEIGYSLNPDFQGHGYASEAARKMLELGFDGLGLHRIVAECDPRNEPSWRLMERLGMRREAHLREFEIFKGEWGDLFVYALLEEEYRRGAA
ncbi:Protein N-acetyltransferase, RimJ/RimL family [Lentzea xinjiangensis]|uniref:Protein N-acetyltransferase, RimJ/RimL family n=1 Tax=Lentzea xinjiangensis TaxID=402600 RepID=A0A1H9DYC9_9PSEU|nr:GNAT family protein [Lentzea xinjiangensis]SEQ18489.1 Protein N-acetyltransferase, RimJ/RimL family [Lentzea xinjiangensis]